MPDEDAKGIAEQNAKSAIMELINIGMGHDLEASAAVRVAALNSVLDRALGKATQQIEMEVSSKDIISQITMGRGL